LWIIALCGRCLIYTGCRIRIDGVALPSPGIGDLCISYRTPGLRVDVGEYGSYSIIFSKGDVYEMFITVGPSSDYELLKDLAERAAAKLPQ
jgi:hypothetical protein